MEKCVLCLIIVRPKSGYLNNLKIILKLSKNFRIHYFIWIFYYDFQIFENLVVLQDFFSPNLSDYIIGNCDIYILKLKINKAF